MSEATDLTDKLRQLPAHKRAAVEAVVDALDAAGSQADRRKIRRRTDSADLASPEGAGELVGWLRREFHRFAIAPLIELLGSPPMHALSQLLGQSGASLLRAVDRGLSTVQADRWAVRAGYHPGVVWTDWWALEPLD